MDKPEPESPLLITTIGDDGDDNWNSETCIQSALSVGSPNWPGFYWQDALPRTIYQKRQSRPNLY